MNVLLGGTGKGLYYRFLFRNGVDTDWTHITNFPTGKIRSLVATNPANGFYCSVGNFIDSSPDGLSWHEVAGIDTGMLAYDGSKVISWINQGIFHIVAGNTIIPSLNNKIVNDFSASDGNYFVATDSGAFTLIYPAQKWSASSAGLTSTRKIGTEIPGSVILLHSIAGSSPVDSSWEACTLLNQSHASIVITGRILAHLDSLSIGSTTYPDVIAVRYAYEPTPNNTSQIPYWVIYYAKNEGPVVISQMYGTTTMSRAIRQR